MSVRYNVPGAISPGISSLAAGPLGIWNDCGRDVNSTEPRMNNREPRYSSSIKNNEPRREDEE